MKKNIGIICLCFVLILSFGFLVLPKLNPRTITTDSGWDSDYGGGSDWGGSDWGGSSSWDYDYDGHSTSSGSRRTYSSFGEYFAAFFSFYLFIAAIVVCVIFANYVSKKKNPTVSSKSLSIENHDDLITKFFPEYTIEEFKKKIYQIFVDVQNAWMEFDYDQLKKLCTDELYHSYQSDLEVLKLKHGKNIMSNFHLIQCSVKNIAEENDRIIANVILQVSFHDYVINVDTNEVIRGNKTTIMNNTYSLEFIVNRDSKNKLEKCPNCGSELEGRDCKYCNSHFDFVDDEIVLSKKSKIS